MSNSLTQDDPWISLEEVLTFPAIKTASPEILTQQASFSSRRVRWAHVCEQADMTQFVDADQLVLTSGVGLGNSLAGWHEIIRSLGAKRASGLIIELHVTLNAIPAELVDTANSVGLPLIALRKPSRFVDIAQAVHQVIVDKQRAELQRSAHVHEAFTRLMMNHATVQEIVTLAGNFVGVPTILEDNHHRVLAYHDVTGSDVLLNWDDLSRAGLQYSHPEAHIVTVLIGEQQEGRLILLFTDEPGPFEAMVADRTVAAIAIAQSRQVEGQMIRDGAQVQLMADLLTPGSVNALLGARLQSFGFDVSNRKFLACVVELPAEQRSLGRLSTVIERLTFGTESDSLIAPTEQSSFHLLISLSTRGDARELVSHISRGILEDVPTAIISWSDTLSHLKEVPAGFSQARIASIEHSFSPELTYFRTRDMSGYGLLALLQDDARLQKFVEFRLSPVLRKPQKERDQHVNTLFTFLSTGRNISATAKKLFISRPALYARLRKLEELLEIDFETEKDAFSISLAVTTYVSWQKAAREDPSV